MGNGNKLVVGVLVMSVFATLWIKGCVDQKTDFVESMTEKQLNSTDLQFSEMEIYSKEKTREGRLYNVGGRVNTNGTLESVRMRVRKVDGKYVIGKWSIGDTKIIPTTTKLEYWKRDGDGEWFVHSRSR